MATIVTENVGSMGPCLVVRGGELKPHDGLVIENLLKTEDWYRRPVITLDMRELDGFAPGAERALRYASKVVADRRALFTVLCDPDGPAADGLKGSGILADLHIDFAPGAPDPTS